MNRTQLKLLAVAAMLVDHLAWAFVPLNTPLAQGMHTVGRLTAPIMAYFLAEGYVHTHSFRRYALRLGVFALLSWGPYCFFQYGTFPFAFADGELTVTPAFGMLFTLLLGLLAIRLWDEPRIPLPTRALGIVALCVLSFFGDWSVLGVLYPLCFFLFRDKEKEKWVVFCALSLVWALPTVLWSSPENWLFQIGVFLVPPLLHFCYNGEPGSRHPVWKWFFYAFYPAHLLVIGVLEVLFTGA